MTLPRKAAFPYLLVLRHDLLLVLGLLLLLLRHHLPPQEGDRSEPLPTSRGGQPGGAYLGPSTLDCGSLLSSSPDSSSLLSSSALLLHTSTVGMHLLKLLVKHAGCR